MMQRVVQRIVDKLGELLREGLHVAVFHYRRRVAKIRTEHEGVSGGGIDAMGSPGAAQRGVAFGVVSGVVRDCDHQLAFLTGNQLEKLPLQKLDVGDG